MGVVQKHIEIDEDNANWFERTYPRGSYNWLFNMLLEKFRAVSETSPQDYAELAAKEFSEEIKT